MRMETGTYTKHRACCINHRREQLNHVEPAQEQSSYVKSLLQSSCIQNALRSARGSGYTYSYITRKHNLQGA